MEGKQIAPGFSEGKELAVPPVELLAAPAVELNQTSQPTEVVPSPILPQPIVSSSPAATSSERPPTPQPSVGLEPFEITSDAFDQDPVVLIDLQTQMTQVFDQNDNDREAA